MKVSLANGLPGCIFVQKTAKGRLMNLEEQKTLLLLLKHKRWWAAQSNHRDSVLCKVFDVELIIQMGMRRLQTPSLKPPSQKNTQKCVSACLLRLRLRKEVMLPSVVKYQSFPVQRTPM